MILSWIGEQLINNWEPVVGILVLLSGGLVMMAMGARERRKWLSSRVEKVHTASTPHQKKEAAKPRMDSRITSGEAAGLTEFEHQHVVRVYTGFGAKPEKALAYFNATRLAAVGLLLACALPFVWGLFAKSVPMGALALAIAGAIGYFLPLILIRRGINKRRSQIGNGLPDALELLAVCVEAGLSLENGLHRVAKELKLSQPALSDELSHTWAEINILPNRDQALLNLADRVDLPAVRSVVNTLAQTLRFGTPLARSLRVVAGDVRNDQLTHMEEKANRLPAMMTVPVMLFIMPTIFLVVGGPAALKVMDVFSAQGM